MILFLERRIEMKKIIAVLLVMVLALSIVACNQTKPQDTQDTAPTVDTQDTPDTQDTEPVAEEKVMTYAEYVAAALDEKVVVETYVQAKQSWWNDQATLYTQDNDGAYFIYNVKCSEEDYEKLVPGTKIRVSGVKSEWSGEVEIVDGTFEILEGSFIAEPVDATEWLGTEELIKHQNELALFRDLTVESISFKNGEPGDDIYVALSKDGADYNFCVEFYLTNTETDVYKTVSELKSGDIVDIEGFLYWYNDVNTHITKVTVTSSLMSHDDYVAAAIDDEVRIETYVQATQSWWNDQITIYAQSEDGAYFIYNAHCSEEDAAKLVPGTKIRVSGYKTEWAGEVEIGEANLKILDGSYVAETVDATEWLGTEELIKHQNEKVSFKGLTVDSVSFKNGEPGDDIYVAFTKDGETYNFCVEYYLTNTETEVYKAVSELKAGDVVDVEGFLYWYNDVNTHITSVVPAE